jgi:hypothetical protein
MAERRYRRRTGEFEFGPSCPKCGGPKAVQASECYPCFRERRRDAAYWSRRTCVCGGTKDPKSAKCHACGSERKRGVPVRGRVQSKSHPWALRRAS